MVNAALANVIVTSLSVVGSSGMIVGFVINENKGLRAKMVLGLATTDLLQATTVLIGSAYNLAGHKMATNSAGCEINGFAYQACTVAAAGWTVAIAGVTYLTLCHPVSRLSEMLEHRLAPYFIPLGVFLLGLIPAAFGTGFFEQQDLGGVCWYKSGTLQNSLMLFVPRTVALVTVIVIYVRIWVHFASRDLSLLTSGSSHSATDDHGLTTTHGLEEPDYRRRLSSVGSKLVDYARRKSSFASGTPIILPNSDPLTASPTGLSPVAPSEPNTPAFTSAGAHVSLPLGGPPSSFSVSFPGRTPSPGAGPGPGEHLVGLGGTLSGIERGRQGSDETEFDSELDDSPRLGGPARHVRLEQPAPSLPGTRTPGTRPGPPTKRASFMVDQLTSAGSYAMEVPRRLTGSFSGTASGGKRPRKPLSPRQLNRRLSILMSLYPIAYLFLFSVATARLIIQLAHPNKAVDPQLVIVSRVLVYAQGAIDGFIYAFTESVFRRWTKRRS